MKSYVFLFWAYNAIWIGLAGYLLFLMLRMGRIEKSLDAVERANERKAAVDPPSSDS